MSFLNLAAFGLLGLAPVIIFFYLLKLRRLPVTVPSLMFWQKAAEDLSANAPFQKLKRNLLLYLQLLLLLLLTLALARPLINLEVRDGRSYIMLIDISASMQVDEGGETRLARALRTAEEFIAGMNEGDSLLLMSFGASPRVLGTFTSDGTRLRQQLASIRPTHEPSNLTEALSLAHSLTRGRERPELVILSDGAVDVTSPDLRLDDTVPVRFVKTGFATNNIGLTRVDLRRTPESHRDFQIFAEIANNTPLEQTQTLEVRNNGRLVDARDVQLPPNSQQSVLLQSALLDEGEISLSMRTGDAFPLDDAAHLVLRPPVETRILLVGPGNPFLEKAIRFDRALNARLDYGSLVDWPPANLSTYDVVIFDTEAPTVLPEGNYLFIGCVPPLNGFENLGVIEAPPIVNWDGTHPMMRHVELSDVIMIRALNVALPTASVRLAFTTDSRPLVAFASVENRQIALWAFDIYDTNMPLRMAFPLITSNTLGFLTRSKAASQAPLHTSGSTVELFPPADASRVVITAPDGQQHVLARGNSPSVLFSATSLTGFYRVDYGEERREVIGVNLLNAAESSIAPRSTIEIDRRKVATEGDLRRVNTEVWRWFALAVLALLLVEWAVFHRRIGV